MNKFLIVAVAVLFTSHAYSMDMDSDLEGKGKKNNFSEVIGTCGGKNLRASKKPRRSNLINQENNPLYRKGRHSQPLSPKTLNAHIKAARIANAKAAGKHK